MNLKNLIPGKRSRRNASVRHEGSDVSESTDTMLALQTDFNRAFEDFWRALNLPALAMSTDDLASVAAPNVDVRDTDKAVEVIAELPGMEEADFDVALAEGALTIRGTKKSEREKEESGYVLRERSFGRIERVVPLPEGLDADSAKATFKNGVLTVTIPKTEESQAAVKHIPVQRA
jgi:HSP20 family protein